MNRSLTAMTINIGKSGLNDQVIEEIKRQLKAKQVLKIKFSRGMTDNKEDYLNQITKETRCKLIDVRGHVAVIYKK